jgi:hypothetical protein
MLGEPSLIIVPPCLEKPSTKMAGTNRKVSECNSWELQETRPGLVL